MNRNAGFKTGSISLRRVTGFAVLYPKGIEPETGTGSKHETASLISGDKKPHGGGCP